MRPTKWHLPSNRGHLVEPRNRGSVSENAKASLSYEAQTWLTEADRGGLGGVAEEPLVAFASTQTAVGSAVIAQFGQYVCAYSDELGMNNCGSMALINEGKLLTYQPG